MAGLARGTFRVCARHGRRHTPKPYVRQAFRKYLECGIFAHGFARTRCSDCGHDYFVAFYCKCREATALLHAA